MNIVEEAFKELYPEKKLKYSYKVKYSGKFKGYNSNVSKSFTTLTFNLSKNWRGVDRSIVKGLLQELMAKMFRDKRRTISIDLYNNFIKNLHLSAPKIHTDPVLETSFNRVNQKYFYSTIEKPNLVFCNSVSKLGSYNYHTDTIDISKILLGHPVLMDYVMYHELLHKRLKFRNTKKGRSYHHTREFRIKEKEFENAKELEKQLQSLVSKKRVKSLFGFRLF